MIFALWPRPRHAGQACAWVVAEPRRGRLPVYFLQALNEKSCFATVGAHPVHARRWEHTAQGVFSTCFDFFSFSTDKVQRHHGNVTIAFLSVCLAHVSFPEGGRELGYSTYGNLVDTKQRLYRVLRPLFVCLATRKPPAACVLWEEYGIPAFL